jgi:hypothetical protein
MEFFPQRALNMRVPAFGLFITGDDPAVSKSGAFVTFWGEGSFLGEKFHFSLTDLFFVLNRFYFSRDCLAFLPTALPIIRVKLHFN